MKRILKIKCILPKRFNKIRILKYTMLYLSLLLSSSLFGQTYTDGQDSLFQHLDKNKISTGVLYERVYPWADLNEDKDSTFQISYSFIKQAWLELYLASYNNETFISIEEVKDKILSNTLNNKGITLGWHFHN